MTSPNPSAHGGPAPGSSLLGHQSVAGVDARAPFPREVLHEDLRQALWATAHHIAVAGPDVRVANSFLGVEAFASDRNIGVADPEPPEFQLERFPITALLDKAYDFAFQIGPRAHRHHDALSNSDIARIRAFRDGSPRALGVEDMGTPMADEDSTIVRTIDTACARWGLGGSMSVRDLVLLTGMTEPAVRNALSKQEIKLKSSIKGDKNGQVDGAEALDWLQKRRGFVPTLEPDPTDAFYVDDFRRLLIAQGFGAAQLPQLFWMSPAEVAQAAEVDPEWLLEVVTGREARVDVEALTRVARAIDASAPAFVARCVEMTLKAIEPPKPKDEDSPFGRQLAAAAAELDALPPLEVHETDPDLDNTEET